MTGRAAYAFGWVTGIPAHPGCPAGSFHTSPSCVNSLEGKWAWFCFDPQPNVATCFPISAVQGFDLEFQQQEIRDEPENKGALTLGWARPWGSMWVPSAAGGRNSHLGKTVCPGGTVFFLWSSRTWHLGRGRYEPLRWGKRGPERWWSPPQLASTQALWHPGGPALRGLSF